MCKSMDHDMKVSFVFVNNPNDPPAADIALTPPSAQYGITPVSTIALFATLDVSWCRLKPFNNVKCAGCTCL